MNRILLFVLASLSPMVFSAEFFVNGATGNNANSGASAGSAKQTIQAGIDAASAGDTVTVSAGTYVENVNVNKASLTLRGAQVGQDGRNRTVVLSAESVIRPASSGSATLMLNQDRITVDGFLIEGNTGTTGAYLLPTYSGYQFRNTILRGNVYGMELDSNGTTQTVVERNLFTQNNVTGGANGNGIYSDQGLRNVLIQNNDFIDNFNGGVLVTGVGFPPSNDRIIIQNNVMQDCGNGVLLSTADTAFVLNNTVTRCVNGVLIAGDSTDITINANLFTDMSRRVIYSAPLFGFENNSSLTITNNRVQQNAALIDANRSLFELNSTTGQNRVESNLISLTGAFSPSTTAIHGISIDGSTTGDFQIVSNEILGGGIDVADGTTDSAAIRLSGTVPDTVLIAIQRNTVSGWVNGVDSLASNANGSVRVTSNSFTANSVQGAAVNAVTGTIVATNNWFGVANGPRADNNPTGTGGAVSANVSFSPWLADGTDISPLVITNSATYGFQITTNASLGSLAPLLVSAATVAPNPVAAGQSALFVVLSQDPDGGGLNVTWDFGDGSSGTGATATHAYATTGVFTATATITDSTGQTIISSTLVTVIAAAVPGGAEPLTILKASVKAAVPSRLKDSLSLTGAIVLPAGTNSLDGAISVSVGGFSSSLTLVKGKGKSAAVSYSHKVKRVKSVILREATFSLRAKGNFQTVLEALGVNVTTNTVVNVPVQVTFANTIYAGVVPLRVKGSVKKYQGKF